MQIHFFKVKKNHKKFISGSPFKCWKRVLKIGGPFLFWEIWKWQEKALNQLITSKLLDFNPPKKMDVKILVYFSSNDKIYLESKKNIICISGNTFIYFHVVSIHNKEQKNKRKKRKHIQKLCRLFITLYQEWNFN